MADHQLLEVGVVAADLPFQEEGVEVEVEELLFLVGEEAEGEVGDLQHKEEVVGEEGYQHLVEEEGVVVVVECQHLVGEVEVVEEEEEVPPLKVQQVEEVLQTQAV